jgi:membrane-bound lytic murein transglycosylase B
MNLLLRFICGLLGCLTVLSAEAQLTSTRASHWLQRPQVQRYISAQVKQGNFNHHTLSLLLSQAIIRPEVITKMTTPYEAQPWPLYRKHFITPQHLQNGHQFMQDHRKILALTEKRYAVPAATIVAVLGMESNYGRYQSAFKALDALTTLAFYYPKRAQFFQHELSEYLRLVQEHHWHPRTVGGSYAGALGMPQFMPSNYRRYAVSSRTGHAPDLFHRADDAILSIGHYLQAFGWHAHEASVYPARLSNSSPLKHHHTWPMRVPVKNLQHLGVIHLPKMPSYRHTVDLWRLKGQADQDIWIGLPNLNVMMRYNRSPLYAICVAELAHHLHRQTHR